MVRIAWGITGCGDKIEEIVKTMVELKEEYPDLEVHIYYSQNARMVLSLYNLLDLLKENFEKVLPEANANAPFLPGKLQTGKYDAFLVAPVTANSTAKIAYGIADTLITNSVAQGAKARVPIFMYPPDNRLGEINTIIPDGRTIKLHLRDVDYKNVATIKQMEEIDVLDSVSEIKPALKNLFEKLENKDNSE
ncbi:archaeoflavoprotein AfpA [Methanococcus voltae]|uniref:archaeoflavoprotein AfpA n=1 Tax=Methanococcus voltae TaxID=2188 RepID=UPI001AE9E185|nr:archaeoflavoprotein AfpA [Methanococcus voltae]MBP2144486.1 archaeoflavoprotein AfpA [Methanococcus voltae]